MPFAWIIIVVLFWIISSASKIKKKQAAQAKQKEEKEKDRQKTAEQYARRQAQSQTAPKPASQSAAPAMSRGDDWDDEEENWDLRDMHRTRPSLAPQPAKPVQAAQPAPVKRHETKPLEAHMHTPVMGMEGTGTEGEDCCHEFMLDQRLEEKPADFLPLQEDTEALRAKALLQGVIFSEVLGRRPVKRYGARRA